MRSAARRSLPGRLAALAAAALGLAGCNGSAVVTLTATAPTITPFLAYRVGLAGIELQDSAAGSSQKLLPTGMSVDLTQVLDVSELLGVATVKAASYTGVTVTLDYGAATIVADDGTQTGALLSPVDAGGKPLGRVAVTLQFDKNNRVSVSTGRAAQLFLSFPLTASNVVDLAAKTVTVTPLLFASASAIDAKPVRLRGPLAGANGANGNYAVTIEPFDGLAAGGGAVTITPSSTATYEVGGVPSTGAQGLTALAALSNGAWTVSYGSLSLTSGLGTLGTSTVGTTGTTTTGTTGGGVTGMPLFGALGAGGTGAASVSFTASQVLAGSSVQGGLDRVSGVVLARSATALSVGSATWLNSAGVPAYVSGGATVAVGAATVVTLPAQGVFGSHTAQEISVGSRIDAFGSVTSTGSGTLSLDASAGRVRLEDSSAAGLVTTPGTGGVALNLWRLDGRAVASFDFSGTGSNAGVPSQPAQYQVTATGLVLTNAIAGAPVQFTGLIGPFGGAPPDFSATALQDTSTLQAQFVIDWSGAGATAPFNAATTSSAQLDVLSHAAGIGSRHQVAIGAQTVDVAQLATDIVIVPDTTSVTPIFAIAHALSATVENFNTFADFVTTLQTELNGGVAALTLTADGPYSTAGTTLTATSVSVLLND